MLQGKDMATGAETRNEQAKRLTRAKTASNAAAYALPLSQELDSAWGRMPR